MATLLAATGSRTYDELRIRDAGALLHQAQQRGYADLLSGLSKTIRIAAAHEAFSLVGDRVTLTLREGGPTESLTIDELVDQVLAAAESLLALHTGIVLAASEAGVDLQELDVMGVTDMTWEERVEVVLGLSGWREIVIDVHDGARLLVRGTADTEDSIVSMLGSLLPYIPESVATLTLKWTGSAGTHTLETRLGPFRRRISEQEEFEKEALFIEGARKAKLDGETLISQDHVRKWVAVKLGEATSRELRELVRIARRLKKLADDVGDPHLSYATGCFISIARNRQLGLAPRHSEERALHDFVKWEGLRLPPARNSVDNH